MRSCSDIHVGDCANQQGQWDSMFGDGALVQVDYGMYLLDRMVQFVEGVGAAGAPA